MDKDIDAVVVATPDGLYGKHPKETRYIELMELKASS